MPTKNGEAPDAAVDELDAGWEDEEQEEEAGESEGDADVDAGWDAVEAAETPEERERAWRGLTPEQREALAARAAARKEKLRTKAAEKAERRKARASFAKAKQKQKQTVQRPRKERPSQEPSDEPAAAADEARESRRDRESGPRVRSRRNDPRVLALLVAIVLAAGGIALFLWRR